jgi:hypothetical protein
MSSLLTESGGGQAAGDAAPAAGNSGGEGGAAAAAAPAAGTVAGGGSGVPASAASAGTDWRAGLPAELKDNQLLASFKSVDSLAKSYVHQSALVGKKGVIVPGEKASDAEREAFYDSIGRPTLEKYEIGVPEGAEVLPEVLTMLKQEAHKLGVLPKQAEGLLAFQSRLQAESDAAVEREVAAEAAAQLEGLKKEWGQGYQKQVALAQMAVKQTGGEEFAKYLNDTGLGNDVNLIKFMAKVGALLGEDKLRGEGGGSFGMTPKEINTKIQQLTAHPAYADGAHGDHRRIVAEVAELYKMRSSAA